MPPDVHAPPPLSLDAAWALIRDARSELPPPEDCAPGDMACLVRDGRLRVFGPLTPERGWGDGIDAGAAPQ